MCTCLHGSRQGGTYYFRMSIPEHLRPVVGKREFFFSLRTKDRAEAKRRVLKWRFLTIQPYWKRPRRSLQGNSERARPSTPFRG